MDKTTLNNYIKLIMENIGDQGKISEILTDITNENNNTENKLLELTENNNTLTNYNQSLVKANNKLLVQLGSQNTDVEPENEEEEEEEPKDKFEDLPDIEDLVKED